MFAGWEGCAAGEGCAAHESSSDETLLRCKSLFCISVEQTTVLC